MEESGTCAPVIGSGAREDEGSGVKVIVSGPVRAADLVGVGDGASLLEADVCEVTVVEGEVDAVGG